MCTLSWQSSEDGYTVWFNRDELHTRAAELPPTEHGGPDEAWWMAPIDPDSGGTWLMVNTHGVTTALLNDYASVWEPPPGAPRESRGRLVPSTADSRTAREAVARVRAMTLEQTPPFDLVALDPSGDVVRLHWDGQTRRVSQGPRVPLPMTSSSFATVDVLRHRRAAFPRLGDEAALTAYHLSHDTAVAAHSINMSRNDASTRSISKVRVRPEWVMFDYETQNWPGAPRTDPRPRHLRLPRTVPQPA
jgi:hypothetical protein